MSSLFGGKVALVTGGGSGIGRAVCQVLARDGARVVVADINVQGAQDTLSMLPNPGDHLALSMDVTNKDSVDSAIKAIMEKYQTPPSLLANCAGIMNSFPICEMEKNDFTDMINVNLTGTFLVSQAVVKSLLKQEGHGVVVNIASILGRTGLRNYSHYAASKGGVMALTKSMAGELAKGGRTGGIPSIGEEQLYGWVLCGDHRWTWCLI
ncbi:(3R)-3-hydroxyacyl-CoA dehydrogenase isoform X2 [Cherax quadricarinatus]|uniref:(3R)-3-hydroxyacyl-CoA dehydrogenase isoform X2 n=1 Tax=Cherax quadricarinatus TaxID=27406 RepID=UPI00387E2FFD